MNKRLLSLLVAALLLVSGTALAYNGSDDLVISADPFTVTLFYAFGGNGAPKGDMPIWQKTAEITGVSMENVANESITDVLQSLNTMLASGELPDIIQGQRTNLEPLISQGAFMPLNDLLQYAPNIQRFFEEFPDAARAGTGPDGKIYFFAGSLGGEPGKAVPSMGFFLRKDWLDKLGLAEPTTLEEYKNVLYAFRNDDPNGNGEKDEVPLFYRDRGIWNVLQLWGASNGWTIGEDDQVHHGRYEQSYADALTELAQWYADGVIDPEIFTRGSQARQFLLGNNVGGATVDWFSSTGAVNDTVREQVPDINFAAIAPPADVNGVVKQAFSRASIHGFAWGLSKDCKDPIKAIQLLDFVLSDTGRTLFGFGIEGEDYNLVDGQPVPTEKALTNPAGYPNYLRSIGVGDIGSYGNLAGEIVTMNKQAREGFELYAASDWLMPPFPTLVFTEDERKPIDDNLANITAYMDEYEQRCLMGVENVAASWDNYRATLDSMGLQEIIAAYNSAYLRFKAGE